ncbi:Hypothetical protein DIP1282 [Corynebacterium diphtheriae]|uniref:Uncharacterized protein n=1 Tax=Corynebacterium diphtheriae (strain ATCC 700971 / NCTC 13129 / Biotype gravis) TaxID=257309 RepID=Q6NH64_CORDI|nr:Hypothetical protein DIP1282 [Corynebacterium diphtheriae]
MSLTFTPCGGNCGSQSDKTVGNITTVLLECASGDDVGLLLQVLPNKSLLLHLRDFNALPLSHYDAKL